MMSNHLKTAFKGLKFVLLGAVMAGILSGCGSSPAEKQMEAEANRIQTEAELNVEKKETYEEYKQCVKKSGGKPEKLSICEALLKVVDDAPAGTSSM